GLFQGLEQRLGPYDLTVHRAGNQGVLVQIPLLDPGNGDVVDFQRPAKRALVISFGLRKIRQRPQFRALGSDKVALRENYLINGRSAELVFFLLRVKRLLLQFASLAGGLNLRAALFQRDGGIANVQQGSVFQLLHFCFDLAPEQLRMQAIRLRRTIAQREAQGKRNRQIREFAVEDLRLRGRKASVVGYRTSDERSRNKKIRDRGASRVHDRRSCGGRSRAGNGISGKPVG